jgi:hypothetical protein
VAQYDLFDHQKPVLQSIVEAHRRCGGATRFSYFCNGQFEGITLDGNGRHEQVPCAMEELLAFDGLGLIQMLSRDDGRILPAAVRAVENNFSAPGSQPQPSIAIGNVINHMAGGMVQGVGHGNPTQSIETTYEILAALKKDGVSQPQRNEIENLLDEYPSANHEKKKTIREKFSGWLARNSGNLGEFTGRALKGYFGDGC